MGRTVGQFCSRASMPQGKAIMSDATPLIDVEQQPDMTWQQKQDFGPAVKANARKSKGVHWVPLDVAANQDSPSVSTTGTGDNCVEAIVSDNQQHRPSKNPHPLCETTLALASEPSPISTPENATVSPKPPSKSYNSRRRHKRSAAKANTMDEVPARAYIPPHLRNRVKPADVPAAKVEASVDTNGSSAASVQSKAHKLHSSPNGASTTSRLPPSPPSTPRGPEARSEKHENAEHSTQKPLKTFQPQDPPKAEGGGWSGWDAPRPDPPPVAPKKENPRWPRTRAPAKHVWPKSRDIKAQPSASSSDGDGGVTFGSNSNGDPDYDVKKLMDWNGDWLPPPEQWSARKGHTARHLGSGVEQWINGHSKMCIEPIPTDTLKCLSEDGSCQEIVPRYWIVGIIEQNSLATFWKSMPARDPPALSDVSDHPPFWERYAADADHFIDGLSVPNARVDPSDPDNICAARYGLSATSESRVNLMRDRKADAERKAIARQRRPVREFMQPTTPVPDRRIKPDTNIYIRPVQPADVRGIAEIYNHYVQTSIHANEFEQRAQQQIGNRIDAIIKAGLPFLVAIGRGNQPREPQAYVSEKIVGYASLDDYCDQSSMYRYTFDLEVYVHPGYTGKKVASCLLDRLLEMANTGYNACGGYEYRNDSEYLKTGIGRVIKTIMLTAHMEHDNEEKWVTELLKRFKFLRAGHIPYIGYKLGKVVDAHLYRHVTTETIDPSQRPTISLERD
ncbi:hypothetical protein HBI74_045430 [Parastagonospora nodorum]|nr:hypothetical protein HBI74_045430 [Parastagonospora nodorum]